MSSCWNFDFFFWQNLPMPISAHAHGLPMVFPQLSMTCPQIAYLLPIICIRPLSAHGLLIICLCCPFCPCFPQCPKFVHDTIVCLNPNPNPQLRTPTSIPINPNSNPNPNPNPNPNSNPYFNPNPNPNGAQPHYEQIMSTMGRLWTDHVQVMGRSWAEHGKSWTNHDEQTMGMS